MKLSADHTFDIFERIEYYESLWLKPDSYFRDYRETKNNIMSLKTSKSCDFLTTLTIPLQTAR